MRRFECFVAMGTVVASVGVQDVTTCAQGETRFVSKISKEKLKSAIYDYIFFAVPIFFNGYTMHDLGMSFDEIINCTINDNYGLTYWTKKAQYEVSKDVNNRGRHLFSGAELPTEEELYYTLAEFYFMNSFFICLNKLGGRKVYRKKRRKHIFNGLCKIDIKTKKAANRVCIDCYSVLSDALFCF